MLIRGHIKHGVYWLWLANVHIVLGIEAAARSANGNVEKLLSVSTYFDVYQPPTAGSRLSDNPLAHYLALPPPISPGQAWCTRVCCVINTDTERDIRHLTGAEWTPAPEIWILLLGPGWCQVAKFLSAPPTMCQPESSPHPAEDRVFSDDSVSSVTL